MPGEDYDLHSEEEIRSKGESTYLSKMISHDLLYYKGLHYTKKIKEHLK
jgi:hypothetical protein